MPRKSTSPPFLGRAWDLIAFSITPMTKVRKPVGRKLSLFKKGVKRFRLLRHYNYAFIGEYQYSPSSSPLFNHCHHRPPVKKKGRRFLSLLICGGNAGTESVVGDELVTDVLSVMDGRYCRGDSTVGMLDSAEEEEEEEEDGDWSVDWRAEKFIERFYEEMRLNHRRSSL